MKNKFVLVVDPFSSGAAFANRIKELYGYSVIALITNKNLPPAVMATFREQDYEHVFYSQSIKDTAVQIESELNQAPDFIVCGSEPGVHVFDLLCDRWNLLPNVLDLTWARRDKYLMQSQLKQDGIRYIPHYKSNTLDDILKWCNDNPYEEYVIKPINSFGTEGVFFCKDPLDIRKAFNSLINTLDYSGNNNAELLIEQKVDGTEYVVDVVSSQGEHFVVNIFRYIKEQVNGVPIYRQMLTEHVSEHPILINYVKAVLTSLGIVNGTSHNEIILSAVGPVLVESGARMHGGLGPSLVEQCNSHSLIDLSLMARIAPGEFADKTRAEPTLKKFAVEYFLSSSVSGTVKNISVESSCSPLSSYGFAVCKLRQGDYLDRTIDLVTSYGRVVLFNSDLDKLIEDAKLVAEMESEKMLISIDE